MKDFRLYSEENTQVPKYLLHHTDTADMFMWEEVENSPLQHELGSWKAEGVPAFCDSLRRHYSVSVCGRRVWNVFEDPMHCWASTSFKPS